MARPVEPVVAISLGDPGGIGPEIVAAALAAAPPDARHVVFGHWPSFERALGAAPNRPTVELVPEIREPGPGESLFVHCGPDCPPIAGPSAAGARAQLAALDAAVDAVLAGHAGLLVTAPVSKALIATLEPGFRGHTEYLARRCGLDPDAVTMVFASASGPAVGLVATHLPLRDVPASVTPARLARTASHLARVARCLHTASRPRIALAALNPHGGEDGLIGDEERLVLAPFVAGAADHSDFVLVGPLPADCVFRRALAGEFDAVIATYHDQALIPIKLGGIGTFANVTMGLPFVRTSPDHGVAYDLAGGGGADPAGMRLALALGARLEGCDRVV
ncbi:MAG TPA: 4-hydroxythreonine-4-phosphate dehydrogenase PdxA [Polyangia bacterium]|nr:4-hydroxythreonine-4-phosphate dehydrogenase PdxA [Polyangia bacterium]